MVLLLLSCLGAPSLVPEPEVRDLSPPQNEGEPLTIEQGPEPLDVIPQPSWGGVSSTESCRDNQISKISIHHSATHTTDNRKVPKQIRGYQKYHQSKGWIDIAYHFIIDLEGNIYQGRATNCIGDTFTSYDPTGHVLIMIDGNFEKQLPTEASWESLLEMVAWAKDKYSVENSGIYIHRDLAATVCPGELLARKIETELFSELPENLAELVIVEQSVGKDKVRNIEQGDH